MPQIEYVVICLCYYWNSGYFKSKELTNFIEIFESSFVKFSKTGDNFKNYHEEKNFHGLLFL